MNIPDELKDSLLEPAKKTIEYLESREHLLSFEDKVTLEKLKFSIHMYELEKAYKEGRSKWN